jgi:hypothetical protein
MTYFVFSLLDPYLCIECQDGSESFNPVVVCGACARRCHEGHQLLKTNRLLSDVFCRCGLDEGGAKCLVEPEKEKIDKNK